MVKVFPSLSLNRRLTKSINEVVAKQMERQRVNNFGLISIDQSCSLNSISVRNYHRISRQVWLHLRKLGKTLGFYPKQLFG